MRIANIVELAHYYLLARLASDHGKVMLSGEGADELFAGYEYLRYRIFREQFGSALSPVVIGRTRSVTAQELM